MFIIVIVGFNILPFTSTIRHILYCRWFYQQLLYFNATSNIWYKALCVLCSCTTTLRGSIATYTSIHYIYIDAIPSLDDMSLFVSFLDFSCLLYFVLGRLVPDWCVPTPTISCRVRESSSAHVCAIMMRSRPFLVTLRSVRPRCALTAYIFDRLVGCSYNHQEQDTTIRGTHKIIRRKNGKLR